MISESSSEEQTLQILDAFLRREGDYREDYKWLLNQRNIAGLTPAHMATIKGYAKPIKKFYQHGADLNLKVFKPFLFSFVIIFIFFNYKKSQGGFDRRNS